MRPSDALQLHRADIRRVVEMNNAKNPRVFGSALRGDDTSESDLDLLVPPMCSPPWLCMNASAIRYSQRRPRYERKGWLPGAHSPDSP